MDINDFLGRLRKVSANGQNAWKACCPAHDDSEPSLAVQVGDDGKILVKCFAGCDASAVLGALGLEFKDVMGRDRPEFAARQASVKGERRRPKIVAYYDYTDAAGNLLYQVCRKDDKSFTQRVPDGAGGWKWGRTRHGVAGSIYRLPKVVEHAQAGKVVFIAEGEKDVETLERLGFVATCNSGGAGKWEHGFSELLKGVHGVYILADNDPGPDEVPAGKKCWQGQQHALLVEKSLNDAGIQNTKALVLPGNYKDVSDWAAAGGTAADLKAIVRAAVPLSPEKYLSAANAPVTAAPSRKEKSLRDLIAIALWEASKTDDGKSRHLGVGEVRKIQNEIIFDWLSKRGKFFFNLDFKNYDHNMFFDSVQKELHVISSNFFQSWLSLESDISRCDKGFVDALNYLHDQCLCGPGALGVIPQKYFCRREGVVYISSGDCKMVRIDGNSVRKVDNGTDGVVFAAGETLVDWILLDAESGINPVEECILFRSMPSKDVGSKTVLLLWILGVLYCHEKKPPLVSAGDIGSGKTRLCEGVFELLGLPKRINQIGEKNNALDDFWVSMNRHGLLCWDNVDTKIKWLPDALANAATNGHVEVREKYSDAGIFFHRANANVMITSANPSFAGDAGLADRLITIRLKRLIDETEDKLLSEDIERKRNASLSWLCRIISAALADAEPVPKGLNRRHPEWAEFAVRCGRAAGCGDQALAAIKFAETDKSMFAVENNWIGSIVLDIIEPGETWKGTAHDLVELITERGDLNDRQKQNLSPKVVGNQIRLIWPHLEKVFSASKRTITGRTEYSLVGLVGLRGVNPETLEKSAHAGFMEITPPNPPNPPKSMQGVLKKEEILEDIELEGLGPDGWQDD